MFDTAFTLLNTPVTWLEVLAFVLALANIACNVAEIHWGWPLTLAASALYAWLFYASGLYGEGSVNVFFALTAVWGWWQWLRGQRSEGEEGLTVARLPAGGVLRTALAWAVLWLVCTWVLQLVTDSTVAWADGFVTAGSVVGTYLLGRKFIANWPVWVVVNVASIPLFLYKDLTLTAILYVIFLGLAGWGWWAWLRRFKQTPAA
jgi:nicotinamide mononucleotide transporter